MEKLIMMAELLEAAKVIMREVPFIRDMVGFQQGNPHHQHTLCKHTYHVLDYVNAFDNEEDKFLMQVAALFHDTGKPFCKTCKPAKGDYSYYGHENVSAQIACHFLKELQFEEIQLWNPTGYL